MKGIRTKTGIVMGMVTLIMLAVSTAHYATTLVVVHDGISSPTLDGVEAPRHYEEYYLRLAIVGHSLPIINVRIRHISPRIFDDLCT